MIIMSVDLGKARTGIAVCDKTEFLASPYTVIFEKSPKQLLEKVSNTAKETKAELIVVGLPKNMDGSEGESAQNARAFAENLSNEICFDMYNNNTLFLPIYMGANLCKILCLAGIIKLKINRIVDMTEFINVIKADLYRKCVTKLNFFHCFS